ncbi:MAG: response regulator transcription factor, partial [Gaiellaceae bacterium]
MSASARILVVDDEPAIAEAVAYALEAAGYETDIVRDGGKALSAAREQHYDLMVLDLLLPGMPGLDVCRTLRAESDLPILVLTARDGEIDRVVGLEVGADDYVTKPFSIAELVSRVRAILRRRELDLGSGPGPIQTVGSLRINFATHAVEVDGRPAHLTPSEFRLLALLASSPGQVRSRREIMQHLWRSSYVGDEHACDVHVSNLRRKIEENPRR